MKSREEKRGTFLLRTKCIVECSHRERNIQVLIYVRSVNPLPQIQFHFLKNRNAILISISERNAPIQTLRQPDWINNVNTHSHVPTMQEAPLKYLSAFSRLSSWSSTITPNPKFLPLVQALAAGFTLSSTHLE